MINNKRRVKHDDEWLELLPSKCEEGGKYTLSCCSTPKISEDSPPRLTRIIVVDFRVGTRKKADKQHMLIWDVRNRQYEREW